MDRIKEILEQINQVNKNANANSIADDIVKQFAYNTGIDIDEYVYRDNESIYPSEEAPGGETDGEV